eukprot:Em0008g1276a
MGSPQPAMCKLFPYWGTSFSLPLVPWYITCSRQRSTALWKQHAPQLDVRLVVLPMSQHWIVATVQLHTYNPSGILFYQINSVVTDFLGVKLHGGLPWLIFDVGSGPAVVGSNSTRTFNDAPDGFDAVLVQNVGSTCMIVSWDLPTDSNGILINFSLYCNGALAGVLPLTVISYNTTGLLPFTLYMYMSQVLQSRPQALHSSWNVVLGVISAQTIGPAMVDNQEDADSLCCYQCRGAITIRWQGTRARPVATWALCSQAQRYYKHVQRAHELQHARNVEKLEEKGRRVVKELEEARLQLKTSQAEVTTLKEECVEAKRRVQELLHFKEALLCTRKVLCTHADLE